MPLHAQTLQCDERFLISQPVSEEICRRLIAQLASSEVPDTKNVFWQRRYSEATQDKITELLVSEGYYTATVEAKQSSVEGETRRIYDIELGDRFRIIGLRAIYLTGDLAPPSPEELDLSVTPSPRGDDIASLQRELLSHLRDNGFPFATVKSRTIEIRENEATAIVVWEIEQGSKCVFGDIEIDGLQSVEESYVRRLTSIPRGSDCSQSILSEQKTALAKTGLFSLVKIDIREDESAGEVKPVLLSLTERSHRTVGLGVSYETNVGVGGKATWEHRNLLGRGEKLKSQLKIREISQSASLDFRKTYPKRKTTLISDIEILHETKDAYDASQIGVGFGYERPFLGKWRLTYSIDLDYAEVESEGELEKGLELALPVKLQRSRLDAPLDPQDGYRLTVQVSPVTTAVGDGATFVRLDGKMAAYFRVPSVESSSVALWSHAGSTVGVSLDDLPATRRYFGGGAQSVRAIEYESLGTFGANEAPIGGRSIFETGVEVRTRINENWGTAVFVEGGRNFASAYPDFSEELLWGGGIGLRYQTAIGPLRIDVAAPFNPRDFDDPVQFYIGLGHAF